MFPYVKHRHTSKPNEGTNRVASQVFRWKEKKLSNVQKLWDYKTVWYY